MVWTATIIIIIIIIIIVIIIIIIIIIIIVFTFTQCIYNYIPETNHISRVYIVAAVLYLQFVLHVMLFRPWTTFCTFTSALSAVRVQCPVRLFFCSSLISCFPDMLLRYRLSDCEMVPVAPIITGITFAFTFHMRWECIMMSLYFKPFSTSFLITFLSPGIATSIIMHIPCLLSRITMSGLLLGIYYYYYYSLLSYSLGHVLQQFSFVVHYAIMRCHIAHSFCVMDLVLTSPITLAS